VSARGWTLTETASAIADRRVSSLEVVQDCLQAVAAWQPHVNAFSAVLAEQALDAARRADAELAAGRARGPLHGVPLAHKDMFNRPGRRSTMGSRASPPPPATASTVLERLDAAGALEIGTLNMAEFALGPTGHNAFLGDCRNPWNPAHVSGGSSSGCGVAVAARMVFASFGSDTGGSVRLPASATGVLGLKPTNGRVTRAGMMPLAPSVDVPGILARSARDASVLLSVVAGHDPRDARSSRLPVPDCAHALDKGIGGLRVGIPENYFLEAVESSVELALAESRRVLEALGAKIVPVTIPHPEPLTELSRALVYAEAAAVHASWLRDHADDYSAQVRVRAATGFAIPAPVYLQAQQYRPVLLERFVREVFASCDVLHLPTLGIPVPTRAETDVGGAAAMWDKISRLVRCTAPFNYLGLPALAVPCGFTANGLPTSFQLVGRPFSEALLLRVAHAFEGETDWHRRAPALPPLRNSTTGTP
jgi:aspartyl-tRNA(Asn)/glutamyl-tRNA(Gln) amidotransferase subunit A